jgi:FixJ family two-component response regulator/signal transduction histidine kinase
VAAARPERQERQEKVPVNGRDPSFRGRGRASERGNVGPRGGPAFEQLLAELSVRFANVLPDTIVDEIEAALGRLVDTLGYDRCTFTEFAPDGTLHVLCSAAVGGIAPLPRGPFGADMPWLVGEIRAGRTVALANLPDGLPPEANAELERVTRIGLRSHLSIPLRVGGRVVGALSFGGLRRAQTWPGEAVTRLKIIGEIFAGGLGRARAEGEARALRSRLWHADRVARSGVLTAAIAHELNQPLAAILSNAQAGLAYLAGGGARPEEIRAILESVVRDDRRAAETIRAMRALLRREESGRTRTDVAAALREVLQLLAGELHRQGIRVETTLGAGCWAIADKVQIGQVALNLILNAAAAMQARPRDERSLRVSARRSDDRQVHVAVCDSGIGIAPEHVDAVFEPFWTTRREGLGLGLAICRSILQAHGGAIRVEPNPTRGVTFHFELPAEADAEAAGVPAPTQPLEAAGPLALSPGRPVVCVVDDDANVRESLVRLLAAAEFTVASYASAHELLERASLADVACLVLDNRMAGMSGLELNARLAADGNAPPVVFMTGDGDVETGVAAMKLGAVDYLTKPVDSEVLLGAVRKAVERHALERSRGLEREACKARIGRLSPREREILAHVVRGRLNKQIAADLDIAEQTVKQHRGRVMEKLEVRSVAELVRLCEASELFAGPGPTLAPK